MNKSSMIVWYPTLDCNLLCSYCISRTLPHITHGKVRTAKEWSRVWNSCPWEEVDINICGGEPSMFPDLQHSLPEKKFSSIHLNSNLIKDPKGWWNYGLCAVKTLCIGWHLSLDHLLARNVWNNINWVLDNRLSIKDPSTKITMCHIIEPQRTTLSEKQEIEARCNVLGIRYWPLDYDDVWQWRDWIPIRRGRALSCSGGYNMISIVPDGSAYRCLCKPYAGRKPFMNVVDDGWGKVLSRPEPCDDLICSNYPLCDKVETIYENGKIPDLMVKKPGKQYDYLNNYIPEP